MDKFEKLIKKSAESYEAPYSEDAWFALSEKLGPEKGLGGKWIAGGAIATAAIVFGVWYSTPTVTLEEEPQTEVVQSEVKSLENNDLNPNNTELLANSTTVINTEIENEIKQYKATESQLEGENIAKTESRQSNVASLSNHDVNEKEKIANHVNASTDIIDNSINISSNIVTDEPLNSSDKLIDYTDFNIKVVTNKNELCVGETLELRPSIPKIRAKYRWVVGNKSINGNYADITLEEAGEYPIVLELVDFNTNKVLHSSPEKTIFVREKPLNEITYSIDNTAMPTAYFEQVNNHFKLLEWNIEGVIKTNASAFSHSFRAKGDYVVNCKVIDFNDCVSESSKIVTIDNDYNLLAPNAFSPNGNGDFNTRTFIPKALLVTESSFVMSIYDRKGQLLYQTNNAGKPWDGTISEGGSIAPVDSYVWIVQLTKKNGQIEEYKGLVTLIK